MFDTKTDTAAQGALGEAANSGDLAALDDLGAADYVDRDPAPGQASGPRSFRDIAEGRGSSGQLGVLTQRGLVSL